MNSRPDHLFAFVRNVLESFLANRGGVHLRRIELGRTGAFRYEFEVYGKRFVLNRAHYSDGPAVFYVDEGGQSYSLWESLYPFKGSLENPDEVLEYIASRPKFEGTSDYIGWLLDRIPDFLSLPTEQRIERAIEELAE